MHRVLLGVPLAISILIASVWLLAESRCFIAYRPVPQPIQTQSAVLSAFTTAPNLPDINAIFELVNTERFGQGLPVLERDPTLTQLAQQRAADMANNQYYAHKGTDGKYFDQIAKEQGIPLSYGCENLDLQFSLMPEIYVQDWLKSNAGHRECLLNSKTTRAGYAVTRYTAPGQKSSDTQTYIVVAIHAQP